MPTLRDDSGEHPVVAGEAGGFRQSFELWVCHAQLPVVGLTERERQLTATRDLAELPGLRPRVERLRKLSHLTWHWALAPSERQFEGDRYERHEARLSVTDGVWLRPAHRVAGWVPDGEERAMTPVDVIGFYATREPYRGERWLFATGDTPDLARQGIDRVLEAEVDAWRHQVAAVDAAQAELRVRPRVVEDGWRSEATVVISVPAATAGLTRGLPLADPLPVVGDTGVIERVEPLAGPYEAWAGSARGRAVVAWAAGPVERPGWRRLVAGTRTRVSAWVSRLHLPRRFQG